ncbi:MAG: hypothetical protein AB7O78_15030 [Thermoleophilia bacterium]
MNAWPLCSALVSPRASHSTLPVGSRIWWIGHNGTWNGAAQRPVEAGLLVAIACWPRILTPRPDGQRMGCAVR